VSGCKGEMGSGEGREIITVWKWKESSYSKEVGERDSDTTLKKALVVEKHDIEKEVIRNYMPYGKSKDYRGKS